MEKKKVINWIKEHKFQIIGGTIAAVAAGVGGKYIYDMYKAGVKHQELCNEISEVLTEKPIAFDRGWLIDDGEQIGETVARVWKDDISACIDMQYHEITGEEIAKFVNDLKEKFPGYDYENANITMVFDSKE